MAQCLEMLIAGRSIVGRRRGRLCIPRNPMDHSCSVRVVNKLERDPIMACDGTKKELFLRNS